MNEPNSNFCPRVERILVLRTGHIGDVVLMTPALDLLKKLFPDAEISALVRAGTEPVLQHHPLIKRVYAGGEIVAQQRMLVQKKTSLWCRLKQVSRGLKLISELRRQRFDLAVDFTGGDRTALYAFFSGARFRVAYAARGLGFLGRDRLFTHLCRSPKKIEHKVFKDVELLRTVAAATGREKLVSELVPGRSTLYSSTEDSSWAAERWSAVAPGKNLRVLVHPTSRVYYKCWDTAKWTAVINQLDAEFKATVLVTSGPEPKEIEMVKAIAAPCRQKIHTHSGDLTLGRLAALIREADLFMGVDTAPMHMAAAVGTRVVAVFGPSQSEVWGPWGAGHRVARRPCPCLETRQRGCEEAQGMNCLKALTAEEVCDAARQILNEREVRTVNS